MAGRRPTGRRFLVIDDTVASWNGRIGEDGPGALVEASVPVNKFPDFVTAMVAKLKRLFPVMGRRRIADFLGRAGLHIAPSTVRRMLNRAPATETPAPVAPAKNPDEPLASAKPRTVIANYPNHVWGIDTTAVPTSMGFWTSWFPFSLAEFWPFCWWLAVVVHHRSRRSLGLASFKRRPTADEISIVLDEAARRAGRAPKYTVSDQGSEFGEEYLAWCDDHDVRARFGAVGRHGSISVEERFIRTLKEEGLAHEFVPLRHTAFCASWCGSRTGTTRSGRIRLWAVRRRMRFFMDDVTPTAAGALSRGRGTRPRAHVRHHGRRPGPRLEHDSNSWPRRSGARGTWRRSRSDGATDWYPGDTVFPQMGDVCLTSQKERRMAHFRSLASPSDGRTHFRRVNLRWNRVGKVSVFHWRLSMDQYSQPKRRIMPKSFDNSRDEFLYSTGVLEDHSRTLCRYPRPELPYVRSVARSVVACARRTVVVVRTCGPLRAVRRAHRRLA